MLDKTHGFACTDRKALPVNDRTGAVGYGEQIGLGDKTGITCHNHGISACGPRLIGREDAGNCQGKCLQFWRHGFLS